MRSKQLTLVVLILVVAVSSIGFVDQSWRCELPSRDSGCANCAGMKGETPCCDSDGCCTRHARQSAVQISAAKKVEAVAIEEPPCEITRPVGRRSISAVVRHLYSSEHQCNPTLLIQESIVLRI